MSQSNWSQKVIQCMDDDDFSDQETLVSRGGEVVVVVVVVEEVVRIRMVVDKCRLLFLFMAVTYQMCSIRA